MTNHSLIHMGQIVVLEREKERHAIAGDEGWKTLNVGHCEDAGKNDDQAF